jgi:hypothetical protein
MQYLKTHKLGVAIIAVLASITMVVCLLITGAFNSHMDPQKQEDASSESSYLQDDQYTQMEFEHKLENEQEKKCAKQDDRPIGELEGLDVSSIHNINDWWVVSYDDCRQNFVKGPFSSEAAANEWLQYALQQWVKTHK